MFRSTGWSDCRMALLMALLVASAVAQIGTDICACQPSQFTMTLNFGLECDDRDIDESLLEGVEETACSVEDAISQTDPTDPFPVLVSRIVIIELDEAFQSVKTQEYTDTLVNGSEIVFISSTATSESVTTLNIPRGLQVQIYGVNAADEPLLNNYVVLFNQTCSVYPILTSGKQIGWTVYSSLSPPPVELCPLAIGLNETEPPNETIAPTPVQNETASPAAPPVETAAPTTAPPVATAAPTTQPIETVSPTALPIETVSPTALTVATLSPTGVPLEISQPVSTVSDIPSRSPTTEETSQPLISDIPSLTPSSSHIPTDDPSLAPSVSQSNSPPTTVAPTTTSDPSPTEPPHDCELRPEKGMGKGKGSMSKGMGGKGGTKSSDGVRKGMGKVGMNQTGGGDNNKTKGGAVRYLGTGGSGTGSPKDCKESNRHGKNGKFAEHNEQQENTEGPILFEKHQRTKKQMLHDSSDSKQKLVKNVNETNRDKRTKKTYKKDGVSEKESHGVRRLRLITAP